MCRQCETNPVYEFTNKRKLCKTCFIRWFQKKFFYTIRKFKMIDFGEMIGFENKKNFRDAVLDDLLKLYSGKGGVEIVKIRSASPHQLISSNRTSSRFSAKKNVNDKKFSSEIKSSSIKYLINNFMAENSSRTEFGANNHRAKRDNFPKKIAISSTTDSEADEIIHILVKGNAKSLKNGAVEKIGNKIIIKPLYLFLDKEVLLYAELKKLKFRNSIEKKDDWSLFIEELEKKHPEVKQSVIASYGELFGERK